MPTIPSFHISSEERRIGWDRTAVPVLTVPSGAEVTIDVVEFIRRPTHGPLDAGGCRQHRLLPGRPLPRARLRGGRPSR